MDGRLALELELPGGMRLEVGGDFVDLIGCLRHTLLLHPLDGAFELALEAFEQYTGFAFQPFQPGARQLHQPLLVFGGVGLKTGFHLRSRQLERGHSLSGGAANRVDRLIRILGNRCGLCLDGLE